MNIEKLLRAMAGVVILLSLGLAQVHNPNWLFLTGFVGLNLLQSAFTNWCPAMTIFKKMGFKSCSEEALLKAKG